MVFGISFHCYRGYTCLGLADVDVCSTVGVLWAVSSELPMLTELCTYQLGSSCRPLPQAVSRRVQTV